MYGFGHLWELVVVLLIALIFLGPKRLPELGSSLGKTIRAFRKSTSELQDQSTGAAPAALPAAEQFDVVSSGAAPTHTTTSSAAPHVAAAAAPDKEAART
jgi:TatA/E family protein of Tat protein translocase